MRSYPRLPREFYTSTDTELMKPIPGLLPQKRLLSTAADTSDRNFVFTVGRKKDSNETAAAEEFTK